MKGIQAVKRCLLLAGAALLPALALAQVAGSCPDHAGGYGPFDYTDPVHRAEKLPIVEQYHFTPQVENLIRGATTQVGGDLDYTIRAFPNHHRALDALSKLSVKLKTVHPPGARCTVEGYFERGIRFKPDDAMLHMIYGLHFYRWKKLDQAKAQFEVADGLAPDDANVAYNLGLVYADMKQWDKAIAYADKAYGAGFPLPGLKNKLVSAGKWREPKPTSKASEPQTLESKSGAVKPAGLQPGESKP